MKTSTLLAGLTAIGFAASANAAIFPFSIDQLNGPDGKHYIASATVDVQPTKVVVTLTNSTADTKSAKQLLTGFKFTGIDTPGLAITNKIANFITVTGTTAGDVGVGSGFNSGDWTISDPKSVGTSLNFSPQPNDGIIGPSTGGAYPSVNASITGNHNPFINGTATFELSKPLNFPETITSATFLFNTDLDVSYTPPGGGGTPEPATLSVLALGGVALLARRRRTA